MCMYREGARERAVLTSLRDLRRVLTRRAGLRLSRAPAGGGFLSLWYCGCPEVDRGGGREDGQVGAMKWPVVNSGA